MERVILHCDCNSFYAAVESAEHPEYRDIPLAVCGRKEDRHGIVLAKNEKAKRCGIKTGEAIWQAKLKCPSLATVPPNHRLYEQYSEDINSIYAEYTGRVEKYGIDESWLDISGGRNSTAAGAGLADEIRNRINRQLGITVSVGVSFTKTFAKLGSDYKKPDATTVIPRSSYKDIVYPLPAMDLMSVGRRIGVKLRMLGINTIGDLANADRKILCDNFGKHGDTMFNAANGLDPSEVALVNCPAEAKSIGNGFTFKRDLSTFDDVQIAIRALSDEVASRLRSAGMKCRSVSLGIRDTGLEVISRQCTFQIPTWLSAVIEKSVTLLFQKNWNLCREIRTLYIICNGLVDASSINEQMCLFADDESRKLEAAERYEQTVSDLRDIYGKRVLIPCSALGNDLGLW